MPSTRQSQPQPAEGSSTQAVRSRWPLILAALSIIGALLSGYLWQAKVGATELVCGPMGDCVTVNSSSYSEVMGIPVAFLGMVMYLVLTGVLVTVWYRPGTFLSNVGFMVALAGALFSLYLTGVEAFVLGAYCVWCLTSWVLITFITWQWGRALYRPA